MKALALTVWDKKIFKVFSFGCHGNQSSSRSSNLWSFLKVHHPRIISVKFHWNLLAGFREEDFLSNCSWMDGHTSITIAHPEHVVLRWAKKLVTMLWSSLTSKKLSTYCSMKTPQSLKLFCCGTFGTQPLITVLLSALSASAAFFTCHSTCRYSFSTVTILDLDGPDRESNIRMHGL